MVWGSVSDFDRALDGFTDLNTESVTGGALQHYIFKLYRWSAVMG
jgi:hypothetical protein